MYVPHRYIKDKDEELGSRLNLQPKQVRSALAELLAEGFARKVRIYEPSSQDYDYCGNYFDTRLLRYCSWGTTSCVLPMMYEKNAPPDLFGTINCTTETVLRHILSAMFISLRLHRRRRRRLRPPARAPTCTARAGNDVGRDLLGPQQQLLVHRPPARRERHPAPRLPDDGDPQPAGGGEGGPPGMFVE